MRTILLVDDNEDFRSVVKDLYYKNNKFRFIEASNPLEALDLFYKNHAEIDIVLCDYFLPVQNGTDFLEIIKQNNPLIKCVLISGDEDVKQRKFSYVDKIFSKLELNELVRYL